MTKTFTQIESEARTITDSAENLNKFLEEINAKLVSVENIINNQCNWYDNIFEARAKEIGLNSVSDGLEAEQLKYPEQYTEYELLLEVHSKLTNLMSSVTKYGTTVTANNVKRLQKLSAL